MTEESYRAFKRWLEDPRTTITELLQRRQAVQALRDDLHTSPDDIEAATRILKDFDIEIVARQELDRFLGRT